MIWKKLFVQPSSNWAVQMFRYAWVSFFAYVVDAGCCFVFTRFLGIYYLVSTVLSSLCGGTANYLLCVTPAMFGSTGRNRLLEFTLFTLIGIGSLVINLSVMWLLTDKCHFHYMVSKFFSIIGVFLYTFFMRRRLFQPESRR